MAQKEKFLHNFPLKCFLKHSVALKWLKKKCIKFGYFDLKEFGYTLTKPLLGFSVNSLTIG